MIEIVENKTNEVLTLLKVYNEGKTKSDWFTLYGFTLEYKLEIFGVTNKTKHCMRLLEDGKEIEVFHLDRVGMIRQVYGIQYMHLNETKKLSFNKQTLLKYSKQLQREGQDTSSDVDTIAETIRDDYRANGISCRVRQGRRL